MDTSTFNPTVPRPYTITLGSGLLNELPNLVALSDYSNIVIISDKNAAKHWLPPLTQAIGEVPCFLIEPGEESKSISNTERIWSWMLECGCDRSSLVVALGGGVVLDLSLFAAGTFMRGVDCVFIASSLMAQADSSIGGKAAVNIDGIKNIAGCFKAPKAVLLDTELLTTLPEREFVSGAAEIVKHGLIADKEYFESLSAEGISRETIQKRLERSCAIKVGIVEQDPMEKDLRRILNFGHTIGHAFESWSLSTNKPLLHGEAVSLGMFAEAWISKELKLLSDEEFNLISQTLRNAGLPIHYSEAADSIDAVLRLVSTDKKRNSGKVRWTLLEAIGKAVPGKLVEDSIAHQAIKFICRSSD